jgi:hypothetical protein
MLCIGYAAGQSGGVSHDGSRACGNPHPGLMLVAGDGSEFGELVSCLGNS